MRGRWAAAAIGGVALVGSTFVLGGGTANGATVTETFDTSTPWTVPAGVTELQVDLVGAQGGDGGSQVSGNERPGGLGGRAVGTVAVTPGESLEMVVGQAGEDGVCTDDGETAQVEGGSPDGGDSGTGIVAGALTGACSGGGGGGSSIVVRGPDLLIIGAGGAGAGGNTHLGGGTTVGTNAGNGGGAAGSGGFNRVCTGGSGGTQSASGTGGTADGGDGGVLGLGGEGGTPGAQTGGGGGGGGGGGLFGGGGGGAPAAQADSGCGGGGGSAFGPDGSVLTSAVESGNGPDGRIVITYEVPDPTTPTTAGGGGTAGAGTGPISGRPGFTG